MANILVLAAVHRNRRLPLRGDMEGVNLDLTPTDNKFKAHFYTEDAKNYTLTSTHKFFINGQVANSITLGGRPDLSIEMFFDPIRATWVVTDHNLNMPTGTGGDTPMDTVSQATINAIINRLIPPGGAAGQLLGKDSSSNYAMTWFAPLTAGTGGTGGTSTPPAYLTGGTITQYWGKTGNADGQVGWLTLPSGSGGSGTGTGVGATPEVLLTQNAAGEITPDKALGNRFRVIVTKATKILNPVGYTPGEDISIAFRFDANGPYLVEWENAYAFKDRQPPKFPQQASALVEITARLTDDIDANNKGGWLTRIFPDGATPTTSVIGYGVAAFIARNVTTNASYYVLRSPNGIPSAMTEMRAGETLKILRNGLGVEAYGALDNNNGAAGNYLITGRLDGNGNRAELRTGVGVRTAYDRGVLAFGGTTAYTVTVQDLIISGARETGGGSHTAQGVSLSEGAGNVILKNVRLYDNENGILSGENFTGRLDLIDCEFDANAVGDFGYTHNIYMGTQSVPWYALRTTFKNAVGGHNIKTRAASAVLNQVLTLNATTGRELDCPNGGKIYATDCSFEHRIFSQNDCVAIGQEGVITTRAREYIFRNCHFASGVSAGAGGSYIRNADTAITVQCIDCTFEGAKGNGVTEPGIWPGTDAFGMVGPVSVTFTGGPVGPRVPVGYVPIVTTPVAG